MTDITCGGNTENTAVALGYFDGLHLGHIEVIKKTLGHNGLKSAVMTFSGGTVLPKFGKSEDIITYSQKLELLEKIGIDYIYSPDFAEVRNLTPEQFVDEILVKRLNAKRTVCGYDFRFGKGGAGDTEALKSLCSKRGIETEIVPAVMLGGRIISSSYIRGLIRNGEIEKANTFLGYELSYDLPVTSGEQLGRAIGIPTINQIIPDTNVVPRYGVYKTWVMIDGRNYAGITNIGVKPTVKSDNIPNMETHILGFSGSIYGRVVRVALRKFLRDERKFNSIEELRRQIEIDMNS